MKQYIHGEECAHWDVAASLNNLRLVDQNQGKFEDGV